jgi:hypothetical protein
MPWGSVENESRAQPSLESPYRVTVFSLQHVRVLTYNSKSSSLLPQETQELRCFTRTDSAAASSDSTKMSLMDALG